MAHNILSAKGRDVKKQVVHVFPIEWLAAGPDLIEIHLSLNLQDFQQVFAAGQYKNTASMFLPLTMPEDLFWPKLTVALSIQNLEL
jgi:hypothetical protein